MKPSHYIESLSQAVRRFVLLVALSLVFAGSAFAQKAQADAISAGMKAGNAAAVSRYFGPSVDIVISNSSSTYSRTQGEQVLRDFFTRNPVRDFDIDYSGSSTSSNSCFRIGTLQTANGNFKVYLSLRPADGTYVLKEMRIEK